jgi:hypothetical protein
MTSRMKAILIAVAAAAASLAACQSAPTYSAAASANAAGYSETQIEGNRYFVTYRAPGGADSALLQDYALLRAADLTLQNHHDWFWVDRRNLDGQGSSHSGTSIGIGVGGGSFGHHSGVGASVGMNFPLGGGGGQTATAATLEIRFGDGAKPDDTNAYDAHSTAANLRSRLTGAK